MINKSNNLYNQNTHGRPHKNISRYYNRPLSRRLDRCDRVIQDESPIMCKTSQCEFGNVERNSHCDVLHFTPVRVARLFLGCNGVFAINAYSTILGRSPHYFPSETWTQLAPTHFQLSWFFEFCKTFTAPRLRT